MITITITYAQDELDMDIDSPQGTTLATILGLLVLGQDTLLNRARGHVGIDEPVAESEVTDGNIGH